jgi:dihydroorotate dehydrogenase electron transfer subunit
MNLVEAEILENRPEPNNDAVYRLVLEGAGGIAGEARPGQFVMVRVADGLDPLLARPFSVHMAGPDTGRLILLYKVVGRGTKMLADRKEGEGLVLWGPLGRGFDISSQGEHILLAGGMGVAPLVFLHWTLFFERKNDVYRFLVGVPRRNDLVGFEPLRLLVGTAQDLKPDLKVSEDQTDAGHDFAVGLVTDHLTAVIRDSGFTSPTVYACGPPGMLKSAAAICRELSVPLQVSLEANMACGVGACLGCAVMTTSGDYARVCREGPVFDAANIDWDRLT